jgi:hypothetical protein
MPEQHQGGPQSPPPVTKGTWILVGMLGIGAILGMLVLSAFLDAAWDMVAGNDQDDQVATGEPPSLAVPAWTPEASTSEIIPTMGEPVETWDITFTVTSFDFVDSTGLRVPPPDLGHESYSFQQPMLRVHLVVETPEQTGITRTHGNWSLRSPKDLAVPPLQITEHRETGVRLSTLPSDIPPNTRETGALVWSIPNEATEFYFVYRRLNHEYPVYLPLIQ